jgi:hypothetical protein
MANLERPFENVPVLDPVTEKKASNALFQFLEGFTHFLDETQRKLASPRPNGPLLVTWEDLLQQEISSSDEEWPIDNWFYPMRPFAQVLEMDYLLQHPADALIKVWRPNEAKYDLVEVFLVWVGLLVGTIKIYGNNRETAYVWTQSAA